MPTAYQFATHDNDDIEVLWSVLLAGDAEAIAFAKIIIRDLCAKLRNLPASSWTSPQAKAGERAVSSIPFGSLLRT